MKSWIAFVIVVLAPGFASARVFDFKNDTFAAYVGGTFGYTSVGDGAYGRSAGFGTEFDKKPQSAASAEAGISITLGRIAARVGVDYVFPRTQYGVVGTTPGGGTELFDLTTSLSAFTLMGNLELIGYKGQKSRALLGAGYGMASINLTNEYIMRSAGETYFGKGSFTEKGAGTAPIMQGYLGFEFLFTDNATATFTLGYRYLQVPGLKSTKDTNAIVGTQNRESELVNNDGSKRSLNMSGAFAGLIFKFYP